MQFSSRSKQFNQFSQKQKGNIRRIAALVDRHNTDIKHYGMFYLSKIKHHEIIIDKDFQDIYPKETLCMHACIIISIIVVVTALININYQL